MESMKYTLIGIVAMTEERVIGKDGDLPWHLPEDLKFFKETTLSHPIVMGRKTYESIGRPLPKRKNIVLTRDENWSAAGVSIIHDPLEIHALDLSEKRVYIIGGAEIYSLFLPFLSEMIVTHVHESYAGNTYFPEYSTFFPEVSVIKKTKEFTIKRYKAKHGG